jgi:hypothetical protein
MGNIIRTFNLEDLDNDDPWSGILAATRFAIRSTYHTTLQATPMQLVCGRDAILNIKHEANWKFIRERKQRLIRENNRRENAKRHPYTYTVGEKVLLRADWNNAPKYGEDPFKGPYTITQVNDNGTVRLRMGAVTDTVNIRLIKPFRQ